MKKDYKISSYLKLLKKPRILLLGLSMLLFAYQGRAINVGDFVWNDLNNNGIQDAGEPGIPGVKVTIVQLGVTYTATTDANGKYFYHLPVTKPFCITFGTPGGSFVKAPANQGVDDAKDSDNDGSPVCFNPPNGLNNFTFDAGFFNPGSIGDLVWNDLNNNGIQDSAEPGIPGVTVTLTLPGGGTTTATTDANGYYLFPNLIPGNYCVTFGTPGGSFIKALANQGLNDEKDSDNDGAPVCIILASGENNKTIDAGFVKRGSIGDFVWYDKSADGVQDGGEPGIQGVTVTLTLPDGGTTTVTTDAKGYYLFPNLIPGKYCVTFGTPGGSFVNAPANQGLNDENDSDNDGAPVCITLASGENNMTIDAGFFNPGSIGDFVWNDLNNNGIQDTGEPGISGVTVTLTLPGGGTTNVITNANGYYLFPNLIPGKYCVTFGTPGGSFVKAPANQGSDDAKDSDNDGSPVCITLASGENNTTIDAGFFNPGSIGDFVWNDLNNNGIQDGGEPGISGVTVTLTLPGGVTTTATTNANGLYLFPNLIPGNYCVTFGTPVGGFVKAPANQGVDDAKDSDNDGINPVCITLASGQNNMTIDAGFVKRGSIGDFVWYDKSADGVQDGGEPGLEGVTVTLSGPVNATTTTDASGHYLFSNLPPGVYCVKFGLVTGYDATTPNGAADNIDSDPTSEGAPVCITLGLGENNMTIDAGYLMEDCWEPCTPDTRVGAIQSVKKNILNGTVTIKVTFNDQFADNTYGTNAIGWPNGHKFNDLVGSDHLQLALLDKNNHKQLEFSIDYISAVATQPSGYGTLGVLGGDGKMIYGNSSYVMGARTSIAENFNTFGYILPVNSPATDVNYTPNPSYPNWIYQVWYEVTVKLDAFPAGFGSVSIAGIHASPSKTGKNTACVQPCLPLVAVITANNGPCGSAPGSCVGSASVTVTNGKPPYSYEWTLIDGSHSSQQNLTGLCPGTYSVTVTDNFGTKATATAVVGKSTDCPPEICYESCTGNNAVGATQSVKDNGNGTTTIRTTFAKTFVDNTYGTYAIGWPKGHKFNDLVGSDKLQLALYDGRGKLTMEFKIDYLTSSSAVSSGYKSLGVTGGDGGMIKGSASNVVGATTSLSENFNTFGYVLTTNSPETNAAYAPNTTYPKWIYEVWYEVTVKNSAFTGGFGYPLITSVHASPSKTGNNTECVQPCITMLPKKGLKSASTEQVTAISPILQDDMQVILYPNPTSENFSIGIATSSTEPVRMRIYTMNNQLVREINSMPNQTILFGAEFKPGMYLIEVIQGNSIKVVKGIKQ